MSDSREIVAGISEGSVIPYLGPGVLADVVNAESGEEMPADGESLILAMNNGKPMAPKLMYEFPRAAMNLELKKGRSFLTRFFDKLYGETSWTKSAVHQWLASLGCPYLIDINRDTQHQDALGDTPHVLVVGMARIAGNDYRFRTFRFDGEAYTEINQAELDDSLPIVFKPMGTPRPESQYVASDADYVDYITELMGGFGIPPFLQSYRVGRRYLFLGLRLTRDTERMIVTDMIWGASSPAGWALIPEPTEKEREFCASKEIDILEVGVEALLSASSVAT